MLNNLYLLFRKSTLLWNSLIVVIGCLFVFLSHKATSVALLIIGRFIIGINNGIKYYSEIESIKILCNVCSILDIYVVYVHYF